MDDERDDGFSRRDFLRGAGGVAAGGALGAAAANAAGAKPAATARRVAGPVELVLEINGEERRVEVEPRTTLLSLLRHRLEPALSGAKEVCDRGACGACTVLVDGRPVYSCMQLALDCAGSSVRTVEGLADGDRLSPVQAAFCKHDALMCGFCTPGFLMSVTACLEANPEASQAEIRSACSGNLCRCGTYPQIVEAAVEAGSQMRRRRPR